jgi:hypothetical protein
MLMKKKYPPIPRKKGCNPKIISMREAPSVAMALNIKISPIISPIQPERRSAPTVCMVGVIQILKLRMVMIKAIRATTALKEFIQNGVSFRANSAKMTLAYEKHRVALKAK